MCGVDGDDSLGQAPSFRGFWQGGVDSVRAISSEVWQSTIEQRPKRFDTFWFFLYNLSCFQ